MTKAEVIADYEAELAEVKAAISKIMIAQEFSMDDGQGRQMVKRTELAGLQSRKNYLIEELIKLSGNSEKKSFYMRMLNV